MDNNVIDLLETTKTEEDWERNKPSIRRGWDWSGINVNALDLIGLELSDMQEPASFENAQVRRAKFRGAQLAQANFKNASMYGADFSKCYLWETGFTEAKLWRADFSGADAIEVCFKKAHLDGAVFRDANLRGATFEGAVLRNADFSGADLRAANLKNADMQEVDLSGAKLGAGHTRDSELTSETILNGVNWFQAKLVESTLANAYRQIDRVVVQEQRGDCAQARDVYLLLKNYFRQEGLYDVSGEYYYREKLMETRCNRKDKQWTKWLANFLFKVIAGYGERPSHVLLWWITTILCFAFFFWGASGIAIDKDMSYNCTFQEALYFSGVTFTTLGYGDFAPKPGAFQILAFGEALCGAVLMAMFIFVFGRKMIR